MGDKPALDSGVRQRSLVEEFEAALQDRARLQAEVERLAAERARLQDELLHPQRVEAAGTLAAGLAHDMNNVLAAIMSYCEVLLDQRHEPHVRADLEQIIAQAERGAGLTRSLLAFSRKGQYRKRVFELDGLLHEALPLLAHTLPKSIEIRSHLSAMRARVDADPVQLTQVLVNFALNAADAMDSHGRLEIASEVVTIDSERANSWSISPGAHVRVSITDSGCGMDDATRMRIFDPFFTTKPLGKGTGLGLALVWGVVRGHGGAVNVQSELGKGSTFTIHLPTTDAPLPVAKPSAKTRKPSAGTTVLVVDDEMAVRAGTTRILERTGFNVVGAGHGEEALRLFSKHSSTIGLVVLDMAMPVMGGAECFRRLRQVSAVPVLIATGWAMDEEVQSLVAHGAGLIEKPFASAELVVEVSRLLTQSTPRHRPCR